MPRARIRSLFEVPALFEVPVPVEGLEDGSFLRLALGKQGKLRDTDVDAAVPERGVIERHRDPRSRELAQLVRLALERERLVEVALDRRREDAVDHLRIEVRETGDASPAAAHQGRQQDGLGAHQHLEVRDLRRRGDQGVEELDVGAAVLDPREPLLGQPGDLLGGHAVVGVLRVVVEEHGGADRIDEPQEVRIHLAGPMQVVVGCEGRDGRDAHALGVPSELDGGVRVRVAGMQDHGDPSVDGLGHDFDGLLALVHRHDRPGAVGAAHVESADLRHEPVQEPAEPGRVDVAFAVERRDQGGHGDTIV